MMGDDMPPIPNHVVSPPPAAPAPEYDPVARSEGGVVMTTQLTTSKMYKEGKVVVKEEFDETPLTIRVPEAGVPMAKVRVCSRMGVNMGNFETVQLEVAIELPCYVEEHQDCFVAAKSFVDTRLNSEINAIRQYRDSRAKSAS